MKKISQVHSRKRINNPSQMMRYALALSFTLLFLNLSIAQRIEVATGLTPIASLETDGNDIYFGQSFTKKILKFNPLDPVPTTPGEVLTVSGVTFLSPIFEYANNYMYMANVQSGQIFKIDLTATTPTLIEVFAVNKKLSEAMVIKDNILYFGYDQDDTQFPNQNLRECRIVKIDLTQTNPTPVELITFSDNLLQHLVFYGNDLYATLGVSSQFLGGSLIKLDITNANIIKEDVLPIMQKPSALEVKNDKLYIVEDDVNDRKIIQLDLLAPDPAATATDVVTAADLPNGVQDILFIGDVLYMCESADGIISKIDFSIPVSTEDNISKQESIKLYPNPTTDYIEVQGLKSKQDYTIYHMVTSAIVNRGQLSDDNTIDVGHLSIGAYLLSFENGESIPFIKQ